MFTKNRAALSWSAIYLLMLLSVSTFLGLITISFIMIPALILFVQLEKKTFILYYTITLVAAGIFTGGYGLVAVFVSLFFLPPVAAMGLMYKRKESARAVLTVGVVSLLAVMLLCLLIATMFGFHLDQALTGYMRDSIQSIPAALRAEISNSLIDQLIILMPKMIPFYLIFIAFYYIVITHMIGRRLLNRAGAELAGFRPMREWMLPKSLVWYYLIALIADMLIVADMGSMLQMILLNIIPLLMIAFSIQAIAFLFFIIYQKKWNRSLPIAGIAILILFPPAHYILSLLGVFDIVFPLRSRFQVK